MQLQQGQRAAEIRRVVRQRYRGTVGQRLEVGDFARVQAQRSTGHLQHFDQIGLVLGIEGFHEGAVLEHIGVQVAVHQGRVELDDVGKLGGIDLGAGTLQGGQHAALELVGIGAGEKPDAQRILGHGCAAQQQGGRHEGFDKGAFIHRFSPG